MDKEHIKKLAENPDFIPGIYNYCDRWCERCPLTSRCLNFATSGEGSPDPEARDINNTAFWQRLTETLQVTLDMLKEIIDQEGIDLYLLNAQAAEEQRKRIEQKAEDHQICRSAKAYAKMVDVWFDSSLVLFKNKEDELNLKYRSPIQPGKLPPWKTQFRSSSGISTRFMSSS